MGGVNIQATGPGRQVFEYNYKYKLFLYYFATDLGLSGFLCISLLRLPTFLPQQNQCLIVHGLRLIVQELTGIGYSPAGSQSRMHGRLLDTLGQPPSEKLHSNFPGSIVHSQVSKSTSAFCLCQHCKLQNLAKMAV